MRVHIWRTSLRTTLLRTMAPKLRTFFVARSGAACAVHYAGCRPDQGQLMPASTGFDDPPPPTPSENPFLDLDPIALNRRYAVATLAYRRNSVRACA